MALRLIVGQRNKSMSEIDTDGTIFVGKGTKPEFLTLALANRHGLVTGATGTGKTVTLQVLAEGLSRAGVSVFAADIKGDLSGISEPGEAKEAFVARAKSLGFDYEPDQFPVVFWDLFGEQGHPIRATVSEMGPLLLSRLLDLNEVQEGVLNICFRVADEQGLLILDLKDLRAMLGYVAEHAAELTTQYGNVSKQTVGTIQRQLLVLENQGGTKFFGEPALALKDFIRTDRDGRGIINILAADKLMENPRLYATFLLWLLSELFEELPEVGDQPKPKLCFFFDEAHLAVQRRAEGAARQDRAGGPADPLEGRRRLFRDAESARRARQGARPARQPRAARAACVHPARPEGGAGGSRDVPRQSQARHRQGDHGARQGRGAGVVPRGQRHAVDGRALHDPPALGARRPDHAGRAQGVHGQEPGEGQVRPGGRCRIRLRGAAEARAADRLDLAAARRGGTAGSARADPRRRRPPAAASAAF